MRFIFFILFVASPHSVSKTCSSFFNNVSNLELTYYETLTFPNGLGTDGFNIINHKYEFIKKSENEVERIKTVNQNDKDYITDSFLLKGNNVYLKSTSSNKYDDHGNVIIHNEHYHPYKPYFILDNDMFQYTHSTYKNLHLIKSYYKYAETKILVTPLSNQIEHSICKMTFINRDNNKKGMINFSDIQIFHSEIPAPIKRTITIYEQGKIRFILNQDLKKIVVDGEKLEIKTF